MPEYAVLLEQIGEGCDYTIGCGMKWEIFHAENLQEAEIMAKEIVMGATEGYNGITYLRYWDNERNRPMIRSAIFVEIKSHFPINELFGEVVEKNEMIKQKDKEEKEKKELERLKAKYGE